MNCQRAISSTTFFLPNHFHFSYRFTWVRYKKIFYYGIELKTMWFEYIAATGIIFKMNLTNNAISTSYSQSGWTFFPESKKQKQIFSLELNYRFFFAIGGLWKKFTITASEKLFRITMWWQDSKMFQMASSWFE